MPARTLAAQALIALVAIGALLFPASGASLDRIAGQERPSEALERYRPVLHYDSEEAYFAQPVSRDGEVIDRDLVYGHVATEGDTRWLQYWLFYAYNPQDRGLVGTGRHEGDWELVQVRLGPDGGPEAVTYAQHSTAETCPAEAGPPTAYVANGSHASYPRPGTADRPWPDPNDEADGGIEVRPAVEPIDDGAPAWVDDPRPWGGSRAGWVPGEQSSPPGPKFQPGDPWSDPSALDASARPCGSPPPGRPWQTGAVIAALATLGVSVFIRRRRSTPR